MNKILFLSACFLVISTSTISASTPATTKHIDHNKQKTEEVTHNPEQGHSAEAVEHKSEEHAPAAVASENVHENKKHEETHGEQTHGKSSGHHSYPANLSGVAKTVIIFFILVFLGQIIIAKKAKKETEVENDNNHNGH